MADKKPNPSDLYMQDFLRGIQTGQIGSELPEDSLATAQLESDQIRNLAQDQVTLDQRDLGDYLQDVGTGLMGTFGAIGNTALLAGSVLLDGRERIADGSSDWQLTKDALERMNSTSQYWNSLQSEKSNAFDRITQYRQDRAIEQANAEVQAETGENATWLRKQIAAFGSAAGSYLDNPDQIVTDGIAQLPYLLTGGAAKAATSAAPQASALLARMVGKGMSVEAAEKAIQMGIVGGLQGTIEGADAASSAYDRVMRSTDTFSPHEQAARESAALEAAAKAFGIAGVTSAVTGTLASKFELSPFEALGGNVLARSGDNLIKALQEGVQETIESGTSQFATNYAGNTVLQGKDRVALDEGVGGAAGQGFVVGAGSTTITNPRSAVDAVAAPLVIAGKAFGYVADRAAKAERSEDMAAARTAANDIIANATTPALAAAMNQATQPVEEGQTTDTPAEEVVLPPEIDTSSQIGLFATGMEYLRGKNMDSKDAVSAFHVLGSVLAAANNIRNMRDAAAQDAADQSLTPEAREQGAKSLAQFNAIMDSERLDKWVADFPMEDIESELEDLRQNPEAFGSAIAHIAAMNPLKITPKVAEAALEAKSLPKPQRDALLLAQELKEAAEDLKVKGKPDSSEVRRSMMQTGFPGYRENDSVAGYISKVTTALAEGDQETAQIEFNRLVKFANFEQGRAAAYEAAKAQMAKDPDSKRIELDGYYQLNDLGKLDKSKPQFVDKKALDLVKTVRNDADAIQKMVTLLAKRTGLEAAAPTEAPVATPEPAPTKTVTESKPKVEKPAAKPQAAPVAVEEDAELSAMSDEAIGQEMEQLAKAISRRRNNDTGKAVEQDARYNALVYETARRMQQGSAKPTTPKAVDKPVEQSAPVEAAPVSEPVDTTDTTTETVVEQEPSKNHFADLQNSYPVVEGASVAEQNDAKNHLSQSFKTSDRPGLVSKLPETADALVTMLNVEGDYERIARGFFKLKDGLIARLNEGIAKLYPKNMLKAMVNGQNEWKKEGSHSLYATRWDENSIKFDSVVAETMAWTAIQQVMEMLQPIKWSAEKTAAFIATYGDAIKPMLADGWIPLPDQVHQMAKRLQNNLELSSDPTVSLEYTEGTMLSLAMDALSTMIGEGRALQSQQMKTMEGPMVQWVRFQGNEDTWFDGARAFDGFFPERSSTVAGIVAQKPTKVYPLYRGSQQKIGKKQQEALLNMSQTSHKLSPLLLGLWKALPDAAGLRLFGYKPLEGKPVSLAEIARHGANMTLMADLNTIGAHIKAVEDYVAKMEEPTDVTAVESFFEYEMAVNGRAMTKGTSPQSSKLYREIFSTVQRTIDPKGDNTKFMMAVAQGFGIKMDKQPISTSLDQLKLMLTKPEVQAAIAAANRFAHGDVSKLEDDLTAIEQSGIEMSAHALSALVHMGEYQKGEPFVSSLSYEIDGLTDGPINLMMLLGLRGNASTMEKWLGLGGLWFDAAKVAVQDKLDQLSDWFNGSKDLYEIIATKASEFNNEQAKRILKSVPADQTASTKRMIQAILHLMHITKVSESNLQDLTAKHKRSFTKKATQAAGYQQGSKSIVNDLANTLLESLSERIDSGQMTEGDWAAVDMLFSNKLVFSKAKDQFFLIKNPDEYAGLKWEGEPLNATQYKTLVDTLLRYGGYGLANATVDTIGYQRNNMSAAVFMINSRINYAQETLKRLYKEKQSEEVEAGRLHPNQALSREHERAIVKKVWALVPHPVMRGTGGLPGASMSRNGVSMHDVRRVSGSLFNRQNLQVSEASFEDPGVAFAALSIMAAGDGAMMLGFHGNNNFNALNMFDGTYIDPADIDAVGEAINKEVKANWEYDYIGEVLKSLNLTDPGFQAWAEAQEVSEGVTVFDELKRAETLLLRQQEQQKTVMRDINSRTHSVSHMAGHNNPYQHVETPLNSVSVGLDTIDPLLDLAADQFGQMVNGVRRLSGAEVKALLNEHTFENKLLNGLWKTLAPLVNDELTLYMSADQQGMADFYQQNERREMAPGVKGISVGNRVYLRSITSETLVHELLHATTKNLTATYFSNPNLLTKQQQEAMKDLKALANEFMEIDTDSLTIMEEEMVGHVQTIMRNYVANGDMNSAMQEFLAYSLTNYHLQRTLGKTKSKLGEFFENVFEAIKKFFGFPSGTQSDSMLAHLFSDFQMLVEEAPGVVYPTSVETALESVNPELARSFSDVLTRLEQRSATITQSVRAKNEARTRMQELADSNLFPAMTNEQAAAAEYVQAMFSAGLQFRATENALLARIVDAVREEGPKIWRTNEDPSDQADIDLAQARYEFFFENTASRHDRVADILSMSLVNPEFAAFMDKTILPRQKVNKSTLNNWLDTIAKSVYDHMDTGLAVRRDATLSDALEVAAMRLRKSMMSSIKRQEAKSGTYRKVTDKLSQGVQMIGEKAGKTADARLKLKSNKDWIGSMLTVVAGVTNDRYADMLGKLTLSLTNQMEGFIPARETIQEMVGTVDSNFKLIQLKGIAARMVSAIRQTFREQVPTTVKNWFKDLSPEQDELLHTVIGKTAAYTLSQDLKDRMEELLTDPSGALLDAQTILMNSGNRTKRLLMIKYAKHLGDRMANRGNQALYLNTRAVAGLAVHGGGDALSAAEMAALENLSTLQALSHLTPRQRRQALDIYRTNTEGFWKTTALINSFYDFDTQRAGQDTATLNFQKGWIPVEADGRKKVKLFQKSEVRKAERMGWVQVGQFADDPNMVYMATTVGKTPTLSGGAIYAVDMHMNGIHFHSGMPTDPSIQTVITHPKSMGEIRTRLLNGENLPYTALYDAAGDVVGFQRLLDPSVVERHTKTVGRISDAAGIWLGRLHEERVAHGQNQAAADLLRKTWDEGQAEKREGEFVNIRQPVDLRDPNAKRDKVLANVWETLPYHTKLQLEAAFDDGSQNPPIWVRRDQLNDAIGYHKASVGNFFTGDNRYQKHTNDNVAALSRQMLGKNAYKYLLMVEEGWQALIGSAKDTIIVKSLVVALNNLASNQTQLFMITGNPVWNLRVQSQKHKELVSYLGYQQRVARLTAEGLATSDPKQKKRIDTEQAFLKNEMRKLSIYPLIEAGEMPTIAEGLSETEEFSLVGDFTNWVEGQVGKLPPVVGTVLNNLAVSKETSLYKGLDRMVQYGDFVAKATMYEWLTTQDAQSKKDAFTLYANDTSKKLTMQEALHQVALKDINDEFVNYARLPGRWRTYGEDMGLLWFYNYKLRIMKMAFRRMRKNPAAFLIGAQVGSAMGISTLIDSLPWNVNFSYSTGIDPLFSAHKTIIWNQMFN